MKQGFITLLILSSLAVALAASTHVLADAQSARLAMENAQNPLLLIASSAGEIYIEMLPNEAPENVRHFIALAEGEVEIIDAATATSFKPRYFDGMRFHRVLADFIIQAGSSAYHPLGAPGVPLADEINADSLGLDQMPIMHPDGSFHRSLNIGNKADFEEQILKPLYQRMNIRTAEELFNRQGDIVRELQQMSVKRAFENQGFRYRTTNPTRSISRGIVALANQGPDSNSAEFFISLADADWLSGKYTVIGKVVEGLPVSDSIGRVAIDPLRFSRTSTVINSISRVN